MRLRLLFSFLVIHAFASGQNIVDVRIHSMTGYDGYENFAESAAEKLEAVLNSEKFEQAVLSGNFKNTRGYSNQQILSLIIKAHETQGDGGEDNVVDLRVRTIDETDDKKWLRNCEPGSSAGTVGIDGKGDGVTAICPQVLKAWSDTNDTAALAAHYAHEYMHILGFSHSWFQKRKSLVYRIGEIVEEIGKENL